MFAFSIEFLCSHSVILVLDNFAKIVDNANIDVDTRGQSKSKSKSIMGIPAIILCGMYCTALYFIVIVICQSNNINKSAINIICLLSVCWTPIQCVLLYKSISNTDDWDTNYSMIVLQVRCQKCITLILGLILIFICLW